MWLIFTYLSFFYQPIKVFQHFIDLFQNNNNYVIFTANVKNIFYIIL